MLLRKTKPTASLSRSWPKKQSRVERGARQEGKQVGQDGRCPEEEKFGATPADGVLDPNRKGDPEGEHAM